MCELGILIILQSSAIVGVLLLLGLYMDADICQEMEMQVIHGFVDDVILGQPVPQEEIDVLILLMELLRPDIYELVHLR